MPRILEGWLCLLGAVLQVLAGHTRVCSLSFLQSSLQGTDQMPQELWYLSLWKFNRVTWLDSGSRKVVWRMIRSQNGVDSNCSCK